MRNSFGDSRPSELTRSTDAVPVAVPPARPSTRVPGVAGVFRNTIIDDTVAFMPPKCRTSTASSSNIPLCFTVYQPHEEVHYEISFAFALCLSCFVAWSSCESSLRAYLWSGDAFSQEAPPQRDSQTQHNCQREWDSAVCGKPRLWLSPPQYCSSFHSETSTCSRR